jgi:hypothetical protein
MLKRDVVISHSTRNQNHNNYHKSKTICMCITVNTISTTTYSVTIYKILNISLDTQDDIVIVWIGTKSDSVIVYQMKSLFACVKDYRIC